MTTFVREGKDEPQITVLQKDEEYQWWLQVFDTEGIPITERRNVTGHDVTREPGDHGFRVKNVTVEDGKLKVAA